MNQIQNIKQTAFRFNVTDGDGYGELGQAIKLASIDAMRHALCSLRYAPCTMHHALCALPSAPCILISGHYSTSI